MEVVAAMDLIIAKNIFGNADGDLVSKYNDQTKNNKAYTTT
ncbi:MULTISPECIES: DUF2922 family protein [Pelotomaculum]|nr:DUF2922 family protein [Pelotomaculum terephthalicicum]